MKNTIFQNLNLRGHYKNLSCDRNCFCFLSFWLVNLNLSHLEKIKLKSKFWYNELKTFTKVSVNKTKLIMFYNTITIQKIDFYERGFVCYITTHKVTKILANNSYVFHAATDLWEIYENMNPLDLLKHRDYLWNIRAEQYIWWTNRKKNQILIKMCIYIQIIILISCERMIYFCSTKTNETLVERSMLHKHLNWKEEKMIIKDTSKNGFLLWSSRFKFLSFFICNANKIVFLSNKLLIKS